MAVSLCHTETESSRFLCLRIGASGRGRKPPPKPPTRGHPANVRCVDDIDGHHRQPRRTVRITLPRSQIVPGRLCPSPPSHQPQMASRCPTVVSRRRTPLVVRMRSRARNGTGWVVGTFGAGHAGVCASGDRVGGGGAEGAARRVGLGDGVGAEAVMVRCPRELGRFRPVTPANTCERPTPEVSGIPLTMVSAPASRLTHGTSWIIRLPPSAFCVPDGRRRRDASRGDRTSVGASRGTNPTTPRHERTVCSRSQNSEPKSPTFVDSTSIRIPKRQVLIARDPET